jgi:hypothetical protein
MEAINGTELRKGLHYGANNPDFIPKVSCKVNADIIEIDDESVFPNGDTLKIIQIRLTDKNGKKESAAIKFPDAKAQIPLDKINNSNFDLAITIVSKKGCKADMGIYNLNLNSGTVLLTYASIQGTSETVKAN